MQGGFLPHLTESVLSVTLDLLCGSVCGDGAGGWWVVCLFVCLFLFCFLGGGAHL